MPHMVLPKLITERLDALKIIEKRFFEQNPGKRFLVRLTHPCEFDANVLIRLFIDTLPCLGCANCKPYTLVVRMPEALTCYYFPHRQWNGTVEGVFPEAKRLVEAKTDAEFLEVLKSLNASDVVVSMVKGDQE
jgi:hypothetical protein